MHVAAFCFSASIVEGKSTIASFASDGAASMRADLRAFSEAAIQFFFAALRYCYHAALHSLASLNRIGQILYSPVVVFKRLCSPYHALPVSPKRFLGLCVLEGLTTPKEVLHVRLLAVDTLVVALVDVHTHVIEACRTQHPVHRLWSRRCIPGKKKLIPPRQTLEQLHVSTSTYWPKHGQPLPTRLSCLAIFFNKRFIFTRVI
mmetsp:Transcript_18440/g.35078  ORF Transcript_18440/g.35078 Transcript_18440/m.35078 type:complete len:203 (-) Transcript_18440:889-1497(-)